MKTAFVSAALIASLIPPLAGMQKPVFSASEPECENIHAREPMLIYEVSGATLTGMVDRTLIVYADGTLKLASAAPGELGLCTTIQANPDETAKLYLALKGAGALTMCDDERLMIDVPLRTVTLLRGAHEMNGRTFSYWNVDFGYAAIDGLLEGFIDEQFHTR